MRFFLLSVRVLVLGAIITGLSACALSSHNSAPPGSLHGQTETLAGKLFSGRAVNGQVAVGSLVPADTLRQTGHGRERVLARQIQEGMISAATQRGIGITEYRTSRQLRLEDEQELMLTRDIAELNNRQHLDYFLTGTYSEVDGGLLVNVRLIHITTNQIHAAASEFFPWSSLEGHGRQTELRYGQLYRHSASSNDGDHTR